MKKYHTRINNNANKKCDNHHEILKKLTINIVIII